MKIGWLTLSFIALVTFSVMSFIITSLTRKGLPVSFVLLVIEVLLSILFFIQTLFFTPRTYSVSTGTVLLLILAALLSAVGNFAMYQAANDAPNAGLAITIGGMQAVGVSALAFFFLKDKLNFLQIAGIILAVLAVLLINAGSSAKDKKLASTTNVTQHIKK